MIIPLLAELDPASPEHLYMSWDMARCLKWGYADKISMRKVFLSELSVAANHVEVPADANIIAATLVAATKVCHSWLSCFSRLSWLFWFGRQYRHRMLSVDYISRSSAMLPLVLPLV